MNTKKLEKIFEHYKKKYRLNTRIEFDIDGQLCNYRADIDFIYYGYKALEKSTLSKRVNIKGIKYLYILALLHEIKHAIDKKEGILQNELKSFDVVQYWEKSDYHDTRAWELRADNFARQEFEKWVK